MSNRRHEESAAARQAQFEQLYQVYHRAYAEREFDRALAAARQARTLSSSPEIVHSEALCLHRLGRSKEAYALASPFSPAHDGDESFCDLMAEICGALGRNDELRRYGAVSLAIRDRKVAGEPRYPIPEQAPPRDGGMVIAYSLFGSSPRYCEVAIMNCEAAARLLPDWRCRFYCDHSVPDDVRNRITEAGGEIRLVDEATRQTIPPLMWRFLAADDPGISHFLMRDADSLIGDREAAAVDAWLRSDRWFHVMRDYYTHTEIMLAGLWGGRTGVIPDMRGEILDFLAQGQFNASHVDQHFLRRRIWPTARQSVLSHDSQFEFFNNEPFPHVQGASLDPSHHVGANLSTSSIAGRLEIADGERANVSIFDQEDERICTYEVQVRQQRWQLSVPDFFADHIQNGEWIVRVTR